jgi:hypothetical protein
MTIDVKSSNPLNWAWPFGSACCSRDGDVLYWGSSRGCYIDLIRALGGHELENEEPARCLLRVPTDVPDTADFIYSSDGMHLSTVGRLFLKST